VKVIKPLKVGVMHRTFEHRGTFHFVPTVMVHFSLEHPTIPLQEVAMWPMVVEELGKEFAFDEGMPKASGEVLLAARAYPPGGEAPACAVRCTVGAIDKQLYAIGDREWKRGEATEPLPFRELPLTWANAFGGPGFERNPHGKGATRVMRDGVEVHLLPNVEHPKRLVSSPTDKPEPAAFGALDVSWPQRASKLGTYDARWLKHDFPGFAPDIDWTTFNVAQPDQRLGEFFTGTEPIVLENMHPTRARLESRVTDLLPRAFLTREADEFREVPLRLDTLYLFPHRLRAVAIFRGVTVVSEDDAADVRELVVGCERRGSEPRSVEHYRQVLARRLDRKKAHIHALRESDLMPPRDPAIPLVDGEGLVSNPAELETERLVEQNQRRRVELELQAMRDELASFGVDPAAHVPDEVPAHSIPEEPDALADYLETELDKADELRREAEAQAQAALTDARKACEEAGVDFDANMAAQRREEGGPPKYRADEELQRLEEQLVLGRNAGVRLEHVEAQLADPNLRTKLATVERELRESYRKFAHHFPPASALDEAGSLRLRAELEAAAASNVSMAERDFTGADLSGLVLRGLDLRGAMLEGVRLGGADLSAADLTDAVLARADLTDAKLAGAKVKCTNFGGATLVRTDLTGGVDLTGAVFGKATCVEARFADARFSGNDFLDARFERCDWSGVVAHEVNFIGSEETPLDLTGAVFAGATLDKVNFLYVKLDGADFRKANVNGTVFAAVSAERATFDDADGSNLRVLHGSSFAGASFARAKLDKANLRATNLVGSDFREAGLAGADLSESNLEGASLYRVRAPRASVMKANLKQANLAGSNFVEGLFMKSDVDGADFRGANLFRVNFARIKGSKTTRFDDANMKFILFVER